VRRLGSLWVDGFLLLTMLLVLPVAIVRDAWDQRKT